MNIDKETTDIIVETYKKIKELQDYFVNDFTERMNDFIQSGDKLNSMMNDLFDDVKLSLKERRHQIEEMLEMTKSIKIQGLELREEGFVIKDEIFNKLDEIHYQIECLQIKIDLYL